MGSILGISVIIYILHIHSGKQSYGSHSGQRGSGQEVINYQDAP